MDEVMEHAPEGPAGPLAVETPRRVALTRVGAFGAALLGTLGVRAATEAKGQTKHHRAKDQRHASAAKGKTPGPPGPTGPTGPAGGGGTTPLTITKRNGPQFVVSAGANGAGSATCNAGEIAIGGGAFNFALGNCNISSSFAPEGTTDTWRVIIICAAGGGSATVAAQVVCLAR